ncbi:MAG: sugar ABC transporter permease [Deinococcota bacterium]
MIKSTRLKPKLSKRELQEERWFYGFISLWLVGFIVFNAGPLIASFFISLTNWTGVKTIEWIGFKNYVDIFNDRLFWISLRNTFYFGTGSVIGGTAVALVIASILNQKIPGRNVLRTIFFMPWVTTGVAVAIMWLWILNPQVGLLNYGLSLVDIQGPGWLTSQTWAMPAMIIMAIWQNGQTMIILLAALSGVPKMFYEAASLDGAGPWARFRHVTLPMISPAMFFVVITGVVGAFQAFVTFQVMTGGGPGNATKVYLLYLVDNAFSFFKMGYGSALAWMLLIIVALITWLQFAIGRRWVHYE